MRRFLGVLAGALFPPLGVWLVVGFRADFWINLLLTLLFYVPGQIHALWVVAHTARHGTSTFLAYLFAFLLPPLGVWWKRGTFTADFWINVVLTIFFWFPGSLHALWVISED